MATETQITSDWAAPHFVNTYHRGECTVHEFINKPERDSFCRYLDQKGWSFRRGGQDHYVYETR